MFFEVLTLFVVVCVFVFLVMCLFVVVLHLYPFVDLFVVTVRLLEVFL